jgi:hypothetical protein
MIVMNAINAATEMNFLMKINNATNFTTIQRCAVNDRIIWTKRTIDRCITDLVCNAEIETGLFKGYYSKEFFEDYKKFNENSLNMTNCK